MTIRMGFVIYIFAFIWVLLLPNEGIYWQWSILSFNDIRLDLWGRETSIIIMVWPVRLVTAEWRIDAWKHWRANWWKWYQSPVSVLESYSIDVFDVLKFLLHFNMSFAFCETIRNENRLCFVIYVIRIFGVHLALFFQIGWPWMLDIMSFSKRSFYYLPFLFLFNYFFHISAILSSSTSMHSNSFICLIAVFVDDAFVAHFGFRDLYLKVILYCKLRNYCETVMELAEIELQRLRLFEWQ